MGKEDPKPKQQQSKNKRKSKVKKSMTCKWTDRGHTACHAWIFVYICHGNLLWWKNNTHNIVRFAVYGFWERLTIYYSWSTGTQSEEGEPSSSKKMDHSVQTSMPLPGG